MTHEEAVYYAVGIVGLNALSAIVINQFFIGGFHNGMKVRVAVCSIIYRKALRLSQTALGETALGKVVNLLSNDVGRFDLVSMFIHSMWSAPLMAIIVGYLLWIESGWAGMIGILVVFVVVPLQCMCSLNFILFHLIKFYNPQHTLESYLRYLDCKQLCEPMNEYGLWTKSYPVFRLVYPES